MKFPPLNRSSSWPILAFLTFFLLQLALLLSMNSGQFTYTLDDPYIHLRLAENLRNGHYGINPSEYSAPSSSILWPFLLVPLAGLSIGQYFPLLLNLGATLGTLLLMSSQIKKFLNNDFQAAILGIMLVPGLNLVGMVFTGMEHSLQIFLAVIVVAGLIRELETGHPPWWLIVGLIVGPLVRYEALSITTASIVYLVYRRHHKVACYCLLASIAPIGIFSWFLNSLHLGLLPSSVIAKSHIINSEILLPGIIITFIKNLLTRQGTVLLSAILLLGSFFLKNQQSSNKNFGLAIWASSILLAHLFLIPVGRLPFYRYDLYAFAITTIVLVYLYSSNITQMLLAFSRPALLFFSITILATISFPFLGHTIATPFASNNIYEQQYQMRKFFQNYYRKPIAVNDLGLVSYGANNYVLDLWGLGSNEALIARRKNSSGEWMNRLAKKHKVELAMIYENWFPIIPEEWTKIGTLHLRGSRITPAHETVSFYSIDHKNIVSAQMVLNDFKLSLPEGVKLHLIPKRLISTVSNTPSLRREGL